MRCMKYRIFCNCFSISWGCAVYGTQEFAFSGVLESGSGMVEGGAGCYKRNSALCHWLHSLTLGMSG
jgi:hypothetical protein